MLNSKLGAYHDQSDLSRSSAFLCLMNCHSVMTAWSQVGSAPFRKDKQASVGHSPHQSLLHILYQLHSFPFFPMHV